MNRYAFHFLYAALLFANGATAGDLKPQPPEKPATRQACIAKKGKWILFPMGQFHFCAIQTSDAGKACSDDSECQGDCVPAKREARLPGVCAPESGVPGGCPKHLVNGTIIAEPCI